jgi:hypothetical protein
VEKSFSIFRTVSMVFPAQDQAAAEETVHMYGGRVVTGLKPRRE